jgi:hypothetical protein
VVVSLLLFVRVVGGLAAVGLAWIGFLLPNPGLGLTVVVEEEEDGTSSYS